MFCWGLAAGSGMVNDCLDCHFIGKGFFPFSFRARRIEQACDPGSGCIPARGQLIAWIGDIISASVSVGGSMWHKYFLRSDLPWIYCIGRKGLIVRSIALLGL